MTARPLSPQEGARSRSPQLVKCLALWCERERNGSGQQTVQHSVQQPRRSLLLSRATQTGGGWIGSAVIAISCTLFAIAGNRDPGALCWRLRSLGRSIFGFAFMSCLGHFLDQKQTVAKPADLYNHQGKQNSRNFCACAVWRSDVDARTHVHTIVINRVGAPSRSPQ